MHLHIFNLTVDVGKLYILTQHACLEIKITFFLSSKYLNFFCYGNVGTTPAYDTCLK